MALPSRPEPRHCTGPFCGFCVPEARKLHIPTALGWSKVCRRSNVWAPAGPSTWDDVALPCALLSHITYTSYKELNSTKDIFSFSAERGIYFGTFASKWKLFRCTPSRESFEKRLKQPSYKDRYPQITCLLLSFWEGSLWRHVGSKQHLYEWDIVYEKHSHRSQWAANQKFVKTRITVGIPLLTWTPAFFRQKTVVHLALLKSHI